MAIFVGGSEQSFVTLASGASDRVVTSTGAAALAGEATWTMDGSDAVRYLSGTSNPTTGNVSHGVCNTWGSKACADNTATDLFRIETPGGTGLGSPAGASSGNGTWGCKLWALASSVTLPSGTGVYAAGQLGTFYFARANNKDGIDAISGVSSTDGSNVTENAAQANIASMTISLQDNNHYNCDVQATLDYDDSTNTGHLTWWGIVLYAGYPSITITNR